jgi:putative two-component system response regulator
MVEDTASPARATILVVDDEADNLEVISGLLKDLYKIKIANNGQKALQIAQGASPPDLILLDIMMPELSGYEVCLRLKRDPGDARYSSHFSDRIATAEDERKGLEHGAEDYITKPVSHAILRARVKTHLRIKATIDFLSRKAAHLERELAQSGELKDLAESVRQLKTAFDASLDRP